MNANCEKKSTLTVQKNQITDAAVTLTRNPDHDLAC